MTILYNGKPIYFDKHGIQFLSTEGWVTWLWPWDRPDGFKMSILSEDWLTVFDSMSSLHKFNKEYEQYWLDHYKLEVEEFNG